MEIPSLITVNVDDSGNVYMFETGTITCTVVRVEINMNVKVCSLLVDITFTPIFLAIVIDVSSCIVEVLVTLTILAVIKPESNMVIKLFIELFV